MQNPTNMMLEMMENLKHWYNLFLSKVKFKGFVLNFIIPEILSVCKYKKFAFGYNKNISFSNQGKSFF